MSNPVLLNKITVVGVGLIGGSFAKGLKDLGLVNTISGFGSNPVNLQKALDLGVIDEFSVDMQEAIADSDLVMLSVPLGVMQSVLEQMKPFLKPGTIITDAGSAKVSVINAVQSVFGELPKHFIPGHPIAGKEKSGVETADSGLFINHRVILTPTEASCPEALATVIQLWSALGANVETMSASQHDDVFAATSHLPHLLAYALVDMLDEHEELGNVFPYTAGGFRDFTRIASSDATMWRDISVTNSEAIVKWLKNYQASISELTELVENKDGVKLHKLFTDAKIARDKHIA
ncbi:MAG: cyclohexadieny/prephenate dehydrogenase/3-phosphoshikimate 1-carboxyvinyltransferase [Thiomicrorhabdus sp.]|nr:MAG: cyclohexadieny/prephenate dehydrogenase/3-phosphoshikimate 1-carboxyvinyltransferase [Thiomicrorhabdus sp.]